MATDGAHDQGQAAAPRIEQPIEAPGTFAVLDPGCHAALQVFDLHQPDIAEHALTHQETRVSRHRIGRVAMRDREQPATRVHLAQQVAGLGEIVRHRLVADDVQAGIERRRGIRVMGVVGRHDGQRIGTVVAGAFARQQLGDVAVTAHRVQPECSTGIARTLRVTGEHAGHDLPVAVEFGRAAVHFTDPGAGPATDDSQPQRAAETGTDRWHGGVSLSVGWLPADYHDKPGLGENPAPSSI
jgi:hypothetical protein